MSLLETLVMSLGLNSMSHLILSNADSDTNVLIRYTELAYEVSKICLYTLSNCGTVSIIF